MFVQITATAMKKWKGQKNWEYQLSFSDSAYKDIFIEYNRYEQNDNLFLIFIHPPQPIIKKYFLRK